MTSTRCVLLLLAILAQLSEAADYAAKAGEPFIVPSVPLSDLRAKRNMDVVATALTTHGMIAVTNVHPMMETVRRQALQGMCDCTGATTEELRKLPVENSDFSHLSDSSTARSSVATATVNGVPLPLPTQELNSYCKSASMAAGMDQLRDLTHEASAAFVSVWDDLIMQDKMRNSRGDGLTHTEDSYLMKNVHGRTYDSVESIVNESQNLEHFHVYSKQKEAFGGGKKSHVDRALRLHTDAGLFLSFIPAVSCRNEEDAESQNDSSFMISINGNVRSASFPSGSVVMMLGEGAQHWLKNSSSPTLPLRATKHAVRMEPGDARAWYGMSKYPQLHFPLPHYLSMLI
jgi:hypothetical protein